MKYADKYKDCLDFIDGFWSELIHDPKSTQGDPHVIPLPNTFLTPNAISQMHWKNSMFYWDTFFIFRGLVNTDRDWVIPDVVDNFVYLFNTFGIIPNASTWAFLGHSQPPFFSSMVFDAYYAIQRSTGTSSEDFGRSPYIKNWLKNRMNVVKKEYEKVWNDDAAYKHLVRKYNLNRYGDRDVGYGLQSELESGWDFTTRFYNRCHEFLPIDLNSYLHKYEKDFAKSANILGNIEEEQYWEGVADERYKRIKKYMWNEEKGFFFDYDYINDLQADTYSLAGFVPMWSKLATYSEAKKMVEKLKLFETNYGLTITSKTSLPEKLNFENVPKAFRYSIEALMEPKQWDYPHIWPPVEYLTVIGLLRYGFISDAVRIMEKSVAANNEIFQEYGYLLEKIDATTGKKPKDFWYTSQLGFGWTNAVFYRYINILDYIDQRNGKIFPNETLSKEPPYSLTGILH